MRRVVLIVVTIAGATGLGAVQRETSSSRNNAARNNAQEKNHKPQDKDTPQDNKNKKPKPFPPPTPPPYNPYPPGILPADIDSELARDLREIDVIEARALARWRALPPPNLIGQPPTFQNSGTEMIENTPRVS